MLSGMSGYQRVRNASFPEKFYVRTKLMIRHPETQGLEDGKMLILLKTSHVLKDSIRNE